VYSAGVFNARLHSNKEFVTPNKISLPSFCCVVNLNRDRCMISTSAQRKRDTRRLGPHAFKNLRKTWPAEAKRTIRK